MVLYCTRFSVPICDLGGARDVLQLLVPAKMPSATRLGCPVCSLDRDFVGERGERGTQRLTLVVEDGFVRGRRGAI